MIAETLEWVATWMRSLHPVALVLVYGIITSLPVPGTRFLALGAGAIYGAQMAFALVWLGALVGASLGFFASRLMFGRRLSPVLRERFPRVFAESDAHAGLYLWTLRLSPVMSFAMVHYVMGITRISYVRYIAITAVGSALYSGLYVGAGGSLRRYFDEGGEGGIPWWVLVMLGVLALFPLALRFAKRDRKKSTEA